MRSAGVLLMALLLVGALALPAGATVHEITGMACSGGNAVFDPPGITNGSNENADNFARPLLASGVVQIVEVAPGVFALEWTDHPASKVKAGIMFPPEFDYSLPYANFKGLHDL